MRSRYNHEGEIDYHADTEHDILRRADEALERRRIVEQASLVAEHHAALGQVSSLGLAKPTTGALESPMAAAMPKMPHEEMAEQFAAKATPLTAANWPTTNTSSSAGHNPSRRRSR